MKERRVGKREGGREGRRARCKCKTLIQRGRGEGIRRTEQESREDGDWLSGGTQKGDRREEAQEKEREKVKSGRVPLSVGW